MIEQDKSREELIKELQEVRKENISLKAYHEREIAKSREDELRLQANEARFRSYFELPLIGIAVTSPEKGWLEVNEGVISMLGYSREELAGLTWAELTHPDDLPADMEQFNRVIADQQDTYFLEKRFIRKNGDVIWTKLSVGCVRKPDRAVDYTVALLQDITEQKLAENENARTHKLLEDALRIGKIGGWEYNINSGELKWTRQMYAIHEVDTTFDPKVDMRGSFYTQESLLEIDDAVQRAIKFGESYEVDSEIITAKGNRKSVKSIGQADLENRRVFGYFQDITERKRIEDALKESEVKYRNLFEKSGIGMFRTRIDGSRILEVNQKLTEIVGFSKEEMLSNPSTIMYADPKRRDELISLLKVSDSVTDFEAGIITKAGTVKILLMSVTVYREKGILEGSFVDITDRKRDEAELKLMNEQLRELNATKDKFFSIIAHDLISPLNVILGFSSTIKNAGPDLDLESILKYIDIINLSAQNTYRLLENLLDWARMQQGAIPFEPEPLLLMGLVKSEIENLKYHAGQKNIRLVNKIKEDVIIHADEKMVCAVLRNLISNAIKFTPKDGKVLIEAIKKDDRTEVSVSDTGIGLQKETIGKLFHIDTSFTTRGTGNEKGTGLGLLLCKEFVEKHSGTISVESEPGKGSRFTFDIPVKY